MFNLPLGRPYKLERAPLVRAIAQVRFPLVAHLQTLEGIAPVQDLLRELFPYMDLEQVQQLSVSLGSPEMIVPPTLHGASQWIFTDDRGTRLAVNAAGATLIAGTEYETLSHFGAQFESVLDALARAESLPRCDRLGVRYVDLAEPPPGDADAWKRWFRPEMVGWVGTDLIHREARLVSTLSQTTISVPTTFLVPSFPPGEVQGLVRHAFVQAGTLVPDLD